MARVLARLTFTLSDESARKMHLSTAGHPCRKIVRIGHTGDGGWDICEDSVAAEGDGRNQKNCIVYSVGINNDISFDEDMTSRYPHCTVYAFDHTIGRKTGDDFGQRIKFFNIGLAAKDENTVFREGGMVGEAKGEGNTMMRLSTMMKMLGHTHIDILKMDIESNEWTTWKEDSSQFLGSAAAKPPFTQLLAELHFSVSTDDRWDTERIRSLEAIREAGLVPFSRRDNWAFGHLRPFAVGPDTEVLSYHVLEVGWMVTAL